MTTTNQIFSKLNLIRNKSFINGCWVAGNKTFQVRSPATGEVIADVAESSEAEVNDAIDSAHQAFQHFRHTSSRDRAALLRQLHGKIMENKDELATIMTLESGKPIVESHGEVAYAASFCEWYAEEAKRIDGDVLPTITPNIRRMILKQPVGVAAMITPWNFPLAMITRKVGAALAAGCTSVVKPSEETPLSALAFAQLTQDVGLPAGVVNFINCEKSRVTTFGNILCTSPKIPKISFTGSTAAGKWLLERSASTVKRVSMELGGNAPLIVFNSADAKLAADLAMKSRFRNAGQTCICAERIFVQEGIYNEFMAEFLQKVASLKMGDPLQDSTTLGPVINLQGLTKVETHISDALSRGATAHLGGKRVGTGLFHEPTVLTDCTPDMMCGQQETFGPVASVFKFATEDEVLHLANSAESGLAAYFFSQDYSQIWRVAERLDVGMVGINETAISLDQIPFGGMKESGIGREGSKYGIDEYLEMKAVTWGGV